MQQDGIYYAILGKQLITGNFVKGLSAYWPPLYPGLIGVFSLAFRDLEVAGRLVSLVMGSLLVIPVYFLSLDLYEKKSAFWAALLVAICPDLISISTQLQVEPTYILFFITAIYLGLSALEERPGRYFPAGLAFGACYLLKPEAIAYVGLMLVLIYVTRPFKKIPFSRVTLKALGFVLGFTLLAAPYLLYIHHTTHRWIISEKLAHLSPPDGQAHSWRKLDENKQGTMADKFWGGRDDVFESSKKGFNVKLSYLDFIKNMARGLVPVTTKTVQLLPKLLLVFLLLGLFSRRWSRERTFKELFIILFFVSTLLGYAFIPRHRYLLPLLPLLLCWVAKGIVEFEERFGKAVKTFGKMEFVTSNARWVARAVITAILLVTTLRPLFAQARHSGRGLYLEQKRVGVWIKENSTTPPLILATKNWPTFYAGGTHLFTPSEPYAVIIEYARRNKVDFLVVEEGVIATTPDLRFLLNEVNTNDLNLRFVQDQLPGYKILVYKLVD
ncbi:MAG: ArnT family glycosyltransferase [Pyrinomonadaceae bacterium]